VPKRHTICSKTQTQPYIGERGPPGSLFHRDSSKAYHENLTAALERIAPRALTGSLQTSRGHVCWDVPNGLPNLLDQILSLRLCSWRGRELVHRSNAAMRSSAGGPRPLPGARRCRIPGSIWALNTTNAMWGDRKRPARALIFPRPPRGRDDSARAEEPRGLGFWHGHPSVATGLLHGDIDTSRIPELPLR